MARTIRTKVYKFNELPQESQEKAISHFWDINVDNGWYESVYEDAKNVGLEITGFDIDRGSYCNVELVDGFTEVLHKIIEEHGEMCGTHKTAKQFLHEWNALVEKYSDGINKDMVAEDNEYEFDNEADELQEEFLQSIGEDYRIMLQHEYEYLTSDEAIRETIEINEYEFTKDGKRFYK